MQHDYRPFIGAAYEPPTGCFRLVQRVFEDAYGILMPDCDAALRPGRDARAARFQLELAARCAPVAEPTEGDLVILNIGGRPSHIGVVTDPGWMLHSYSGGSAVIESYNDMRWRRRVEGFYRYVG